MKKTIIFSGLLILLFGASSFAHDMIVAGAGNADANGTYIETGTHNGKPRYFKEGDESWQIIWQGGMWMIAQWGMPYCPFFQDVATPDLVSEWHGMMKPGDTPTVTVAGRGLSYECSTFIENEANDGSYPDPIIITYNEFDSDVLTGNIDDDFIADNKVTVTNVPAGLTAEIIKTESDELTFSLTGNADNLEQGDIVSDITVEFLDAAFVEGNASDVTNYIKSDIATQNVITFSGGSGTAGYPYLIGNKLDLLILSENWTEVNYWKKHYLQIADIVFEDSDFQEGGDFYNDGEGWKPIGTSSVEFEGSYDGGNHTITSLYISSNSSQPTGFFGRIGRAEIMNIGLVNVDITENELASHTGGLVGNVDWGGKIKNSFVTGTVTAIYDVVGGFVGLNDGSIENSYADVVVSGNNHVGGFVGRIWYSGSIESCFALGDVSGTNTVGGFAGFSYNDIENSYSRGNVSRSSGSYTMFGGFIGRSYQSKIINSYSTGSVTFDGIIQTNRGFAGSVYAGGGHEMTDNFWDTETSGANSTAGSEGDATGKTTAEMTTESTFTDAGWDFTDIWTIDNELSDCFPRFQWQEIIPDAPHYNSFSTEQSCFLRY